MAVTPLFLLYLCFLFFLCLESVTDMTSRDTLSSDAIMELLLWVGFNPVRSALGCDLELLSRVLCLSFPTCISDLSLVVQDLSSMPHLSSSKENAWKSYFQTSFVQQHFNLLQPQLRCDEISSFSPDLNLIDTQFLQ